MDAQEREGRPDHPLERLIFFSDAVFAIAITLLVVELRPEHLPEGSSDTAYLVWLLERLPELLAFFISFFVIGAFWYSHHHAFTLAGRYSPRLNTPNVMLLCAVAFMPFVTAFMGVNMGTRVPTLLYDAMLVVMGLLTIWLVRRITEPPILAADVPPLLVATTRVRGYSVLIAAIAAMLATLIDARFSQVLLLAIPFLQHGLQHRARRRFAGTPDPAAGLAGVKETPMAKPTETQPAPNLSTEHQQKGDARRPSDLLDKEQPDHGKPDEKTSLLDKD